MIQKFIDAWNKNNGILEEYFRITEQSDYASYEDLIKLVFDMVINPYLYLKYNRCEYSTNDIKVIDDGGCEGTQIFILHERISYPSIGDYIYTHTYYGTCSGCDALMAINDEYSSDGLPTEEQIKDYMTLCLHLVEKCHYLYCEEEISDD